MKYIPIEIQFVICGAIGGLCSIAKIGNKRVDNVLGTIFISGVTGLIIYYASSYIGIKDNLLIILSIFSGYFHNRVWGLIEKFYAKKEKEVEKRIDVND